MLHLPGGIEQWYDQFENQFIQQVNDKELKQEFYNIHEPKVKWGLNDHC